MFSRALVVGQFSLSIALVVGALLMTRQMRFLRDMDLGFKAEQVVVIDTGTQEGLGEADRGRLVEVYRQLVSQHSQVLSVSMGNMSFGKGDRCWAIFEYGGRENYWFAYMIDYDYVKTLGMELVEGREFSPDFPGDRDTSMLVNEALIRQLGLDEPIGKKLPLQIDPGAFLDATIVGVVRDFQVSPHQEISPAVFRLGTGIGWLRYVFVRIRPGDIPGTLAVLEKTWRNVVADQSFVFSFLDQDVDRVFREDERWMQITRYAAGFALFVSCLGVFGLTSLAVARRTKEIGIRKVLGASVPSIVVLVSREFTYLVLAANLIAWPVAYFAMHRWLESFAYRVELGPGVFALGGLLALGIAWVTVSYQAIKAAMANPVEALRYE